MIPVNCHAGLNVIDEDEDLGVDDSDFDMGPEEPHPNVQASAPPLLNDGLIVEQGGAMVAKAGPSSLVVLGRGSRVPRTLSASTVGELVKQATPFGYTVVLIPPDLDVTGVRLSLDGGAGICRGSFCSGSGSSPMTDERVPISGSNDSVSYIFEAPARVPVVIHKITGR